MEMFDLIKKAMFTGIGMAAMTKDRIEELAADFISKGNLSEQEGRKLVDEMMKKSEESQAEIRKQLDELVQAALVKMEVARKSQIDELREEIRILREMVEKQQGEAVGNQE
jgi:polyhydroxyalkanoate synthesis regulator phasin